MPDLDDLLTPDISRAAGDAAQPPELTSILRRGTRRRRTRGAALVAGAAGAVAVVAWASLAMPGTTTSPAPPPVSHPPHPSPTPSRDPSRDPSQSPSQRTFDAQDRAAAQAVLSSPRALINALAVIPGHPDRRISEWYVCHDPTCSHRHNALTVSGTGFADAHLVELPVQRSSWFLEPAGPDHFAVALSGGRRQLVDLTGHVTAITVSGSSGPLTGDEVALHAPIRGFLAVDPATGAAHRLSVPPGTDTLRQTTSGQLRVLSLSTYSWSDDGGASWHHLALDLVSNEIPELVPTTSDTVHAVLVGGDGATLFPWDRVLESTNGTTWTTYDGPSTPTAYVDSPVVMPDGRLLIDVQVWSDQRAGKPAPRPVGFYTGSDWSATTSVGMGAPFDVSPNRSMMNILALAVTPDVVSVYAQTPEQTGVVSSSDGGVTWDPEAAR